MNMQLSLLEPEPIVGESVAVSKPKSLPAQSAPAPWIRQWALLIFLTASTYVLMSRFVLQTVQV